jgi:hypothetical protein
MIWPGRSLSQSCLQRGCLQAGYPGRAQSQTRLAGTLAAGKCFPGVTFAAAAATNNGSALCQHAWVSWLRLLLI